MYISFYSLPDGGFAADNSDKCKQCAVGCKFTDIFSVAVDKHFDNENSFCVCYCDVAQTDRRIVFVAVGSRASRSGYRIIRNAVGKKSLCHFAHYLFADHAVFFYGLHFNVQSSDFRAAALLRPAVLPARALLLDIRCWSMASI